MSETQDWENTTWKGNRLRQHREFNALTFREKLLRLEQLAATARLLRPQRVRQHPAAPVPDEADGQ